jgi:hypothetical protein
MRVCYLDCHEAGLCSYLVIRKTYSSITAVLLPSVTYLLTLPRNKNGYAPLWSAAEHFIPLDRNTRPSWVWVRFGLYYAHPCPVTPTRRSYTRTKSQTFPFCKGFSPESYKFKNALFLLLNAPGRLCSCHLYLLFEGGGSLIIMTTKIHEILKCFEIASKLIAHFLVDFFSCTLAVFYHN